VKLLDRFRASAFSPPDPVEIARQEGVSEAQLRPVIDFCVSGRELIRVDRQFYLHHECYDQLQKRMVEGLGTGDGLTMSQIKDLLGTSRKYAVPICEHLDTIGLTKRQGDRRVLGQPPLGDSPRD
jgi:selenocysteine-specific elongation factor